MKIFNKKKKLNITELIEKPYEELNEEEKAQVDKFQKDLDLSFDEMMKKEEMHNQKWLELIAEIKNEKQIPTPALDKEVEK